MTAHLATEMAARRAHEYAEHIHRQQPSLQMLALAHCDQHPHAAMFPNASQLPANVLNAPNLMAQFAADKTAQLSPEAMKKMRETAQDSETPNAKRTTPVATSTPSVASAKKAGDPSPRKKITDIANTLQKKASQKSVSEGDKSPSSTHSSSGHSSARNDDQPLNLSRAAQSPSLTHSTALSSKS